MTREEAIKIIDCYDIGFYDLSGEKIPADKLADAFDMAIEALSEPSGDLISRADAIEAMCTMGTELERNGKTMMTMVDAKYAFIEVLDLLPSAEPKVFTEEDYWRATDAEWIPCSERLPSEGGDYLCTIPLDACETYTKVLTFYKGKFYEDDIDEWGAMYHDDVLAWMPLPKPYRVSGLK